MSLIWLLSFEKEGEIKYCQYFSSFEDYFSPYKCEFRCLEFRDSDTILNYHGFKKLKLLKIRFNIIIKLW